MLYLNNLDPIYGLDWGKMGGGTVIAITQEFKTGRIITGGIMTPNALEINLKSQRLRSPWCSRIMLAQPVVTRNIFCDCDRDTLLFEIEGDIPLISRFTEVVDLSVITCLGCENSRCQILTIIQDELTGIVLMAGIMNQDAVKKTAESNLVTLWSRTRNKLWTKGETSGNFLALRKVYKDFESCSVVLTVDPVGPVCHTGAETCFKELNGSMREYRKGKNEW